MKASEFRKLIREEVRKTLNEATGRVYTLKITNKNGTSTTHSVVIDDPNSRELLNIIELLQSSKNVSRVQVLDDGKPL